MNENTNNINDTNETVVVYRPLIDGTAAVIIVCILAYAFYKVKQLNAPRQSGWSRMWDTVWNNIAEDF